MTPHPCLGSDQQEEPEEGPCPGTTVEGKYVIRRVVGVGGMCVVAAAANVTLGQLFALKILRGKFARNKEMVVRFLREARAAARLKSEHVGRVFDVSMLDTGEPFMVMEYLEGQDLGDVLGEVGAIHWREAVEYILQACDAIAEAHAAGLVHRDLKPENLFLTRRADGQALVKVLDFGIAKALHPTDSGPNSALTQQNTTFGTPAYMSPEQLRDARGVDARSDLFSLGVLLYELASGRLPFEGASVAEVHAAILRTEPIPLTELDSGIPRELDAVVAKCLAKDRFDRFQNVGELAQALVPFAPARAKQYGDRVARIVRAGSSAPINDEVTDIADSNPRYSLALERRRRGSPTPSVPRGEAVTLVPGKSTPPASAERPKRARLWFGAALAVLLGVLLALPVVVFRRGLGSEGSIKTADPVLGAVSALALTDSPPQASLSPTAEVPFPVETAARKETPSTGKSVSSTRTTPAGTTWNKEADLSKIPEDYDPYKERK